MRVQVVHQRDILLLGELLLVLAAIDCQVWRLVMRLRGFERLVAYLVEGHSSL